MVDREYNNNYNNNNNNNNNKKIYKNAKMFDLNLW